MTIGAGFTLTPVVLHAGGHSLVTEHAGEPGLADAVPGVDAEAVHAALVSLAPVTVGSLPSGAAPALKKRKSTFNIGYN